jgi:hypothetical protein
MSTQPLITVQMSADELRYLVACGPALLQNIPAKSLPTYCHFDKNQIIQFSKRIRELMDQHGLDM